jgi:hypothetical protein
VLERVLDQVVEHLVESLARGARGRCAVELRLECDPELLRVRRPGVDPSADDLVQVDGACCRRLVGTREDEQAGDESREALDLVDRRVQLAPPVVVEVALEVLEAKAKCSQRCAQLVRCVRDEVLLRAEERVELRDHVVELDRERADLWRTLILRRTRGEVTSRGLCGGRLDVAERPPRRSAQARARRQPPPRARPARSRATSAGSGERARRRRTSGR